MCLPPLPDANEMPAVTQKPPVPECDNMNRIAEDMEVLHNAPLSARRTTSEYVMLCMIGFGSLDRRDALLRVVQWTLEPLLLYSSFIKEPPSNEFEAIIITKKQVVFDDVEAWLELFNMGICCIQFDGYMQPDMVTCISRIHHLGKHWFGTFKSKSAARVRRDFYAQYGKDQRARDIARVLDVTGLAMTPQNMLRLHDRVVTLQNRVSSLERELQAVHRGAASEAIEPDVSFATLSRVNLANAYRRLQARGEIPSDANPHHSIQNRNGLPAIAIPAVMQPVSHEDLLPPPPPPPSDLPIYIASTEPLRAQAHPMSFVRRPPPTGEVVVFVVRD